MQWEYVQKACTRMEAMALQTTQQTYCTGDKSGLALEEPNHQWWGVMSVSKDDNTKVAPDANTPKQTHQQHAMHSGYTTT